MSAFDDHLRGELEHLEARGLLRQATTLPAQILVLCSNDYLGYAAETLATLPVADAASGAGASRLISGDRHEHRAAEGAVAEWLGTQSALVLSSGYAANVGVMSSLTGADDVVISDANNHASIIDGCRLSRARVIVSDHLDLASVERGLEQAHAARQRWIVTESYFSMDGDAPDLSALRALADRHNAYLIVDEAHALGIFGERGSGRCAEAGIQADVLMGTFGKALGLAGAFVAGSEHLRSWLWNRARSFVFSTAMPPWLAAAAVVRIQRVGQDDASRARLWNIIERVRSRLRDAGAPIATSSIGPILPWLTSDATAALALRDDLIARGVFVQAIRPPTVPADASRLRITLHAKLTDAEIALGLEALLACHDATRASPRQPPPAQTS